MFRNFYVKTEGNGEFDALSNGDNSCAFFVSAILVLCKKLDNVHGTVMSTVDDMQKTGWVLVDGVPAAGDVIEWEALKFEDGIKEHIGFSIGHGRAISTSWTEKTPVEHDDQFDGKRAITRIFRMPKWD